MSLWVPEGRSRIWTEGKPQSACVRVCVCVHTCREGGVGLSCRAAHRERGPETSAPTALSSLWRVWAVQVDLDDTDTDRCFQVRLKGSNSCAVL